MKMIKTRTYSELSRLETFDERYEYLKLGGITGSITFGFDRWVNQRFYKSSEWETTRDHVIIRDHGCDLGVPGYDIFAQLIVHHMNPISLNNILHGDEAIIDPEFLITTSLRTHNAIHYGNFNLLPRDPVDRQRGDTTLW
jgi:hypothetical protein